MDLLDRIRSFSQLTDGQLVWAPMKDHYEDVVLGDPKKKQMRTYAVNGGGRDKFIQQLKEQFPKESAGIDRYIQLIDKTRNEVKGFVSLKFMPSWMSRLLVKTGLVNYTTDYFKLSSRTLTEVLEEITQDKELRAVLSYNFGDYGTLPKGLKDSIHILYFHLQISAIFILL